MNKEIVIIDYGMGNLWSVSSALDYLGHKSLITSNTNIIKSAVILVLPGVGAFRKAMETLNETGLSEAIIEAVTINKSKILGICLGMQLLGNSSTENGFTSGLGLINSQTDKFSDNLNINFKIPHVGFNSVFHSDDSRLFNQLESGSDFYFTHSYKMNTTNEIGIESTSRYGVDFLAAYENENIFATQFHPEKSQSNGLRLLKNFIDS